MDKDVEINTELYLAIQENCKIFNPSSVTMEDYNRAYEVAREIIYLRERKEIPRSRTIKFNELLISSLTNLYKIGIDNVIKDATSIIKDLEYKEIYNSRCSSFLTNFMAEQTGSSVCKRAVSVYVPDRLTEASGVFMSHEVVHILKERNSLECPNINTTLEVIPMLVELIMAFNSNPILLKEIVYERIELLYSEAKMFFRIVKELKTNKKNKDGLMAALYSNIAYLNSFYYSLALFTLYLKDSDYVIAMIKCNLSKKMTTDDIIRDSFLFDDSLDSYNSGLACIKKVY